MVTRFDQEITLHVVRGGVCNFDDMDDHYLKLSFKRYDCPEMVNFLRMLDIWLVETNNVSWKISIGNIVLGKIIIKNGIHSYQIETNMELWQLDTSKKVTCFIDEFF